MEEIKRYACPNCGIVTNVGQLGELDFKTGKYRSYTFCRKCDTELESIEKPFPTVKKSN